MEVALGWRELNGAKCGCLLLDVMCITRITAASTLFKCVIASQDKLLPAQDHGELKDYCCCNARAACVIREKLASTTGNCHIIHAIA